jgi:hypothetical protein
MKIDALQTKITTYIGSEAPSAVVMEASIFSGITPRRPLNVYTFHCLPQGRRVRKSGK